VTSASATDCAERQSANGGNSVAGGRTAAARTRDGGVDQRTGQSGTEFDRGSNQRWDVKRVTEGGSAGLRKCRAQRACGFGDPRFDLDSRVAAGGEMAQIMNDGTILSCQKQHQERQ